MKYPELYFLTGVGVGIVLFGIIVTVFDGPFSQGKAALARCQEGLPSNQSCVITAVPKEEKHK